MRKIFIFLSLAALCITACDCPDCGTLAFSPDVNTIFVTKDAGGTFHINPEHIVLKSSCQWAATNMTSQYLDFNNTNGGGGVFYLPISLTAAFFEALAEDISQFPLDAVGYKIGSIHFDSNCEAGFDVDIYLKDFLVLSFDLNDGIGTAPKSIYFVAGENITLPGTGATYSGKDFVGWGAQANGKGVFYDDGSLASFSSNTTLHALWSGDGSDAANSKYIYNHCTLDAVRNTAANKLHYLVVADFNANYDEVVNHLYDSWEPIGGTANAFTGFLDGNGHTISYTIDDSVQATSHFGLFAYVGTADGLTSGRINDLAVNGKISLTNVGGTSYTGGVAAYLRTGEISNCKVDMDIDVTNVSAMAVGGVVGMNDSDKALVQNVYVSGNISGVGATSYVGGIAGTNQNGATIEKVYVAMNVLSKGSYEAFAGGIAGYLSNGIVLNTHTSGGVTVQDLGSGDANAGGIAGYFNGGTLQNSYATGEINGSGSSIITGDYVRVGGIVGYVRGKDVSNYAYLQNCVALNNRVSTNKGDDVARIWGYNYNYVTRECNYGQIGMVIDGRPTTGDSLLHNNRNGANCAAPPTGDWWQNTSNWSSGLAWDFSTIWIMGTDGYPKLQSLIDLY